MHVFSTMKGFTLIEVMVVVSITVVLTGLLITNFSRSRIDLSRTLIMVQDSIREAQADALSGSLIRGSYRCGYGIHFDTNSYFIYAGPDSSAADCSAQNKNYESGIDQIIRQANFGNNILEFYQSPPPPDIFFEPPNPTTYINNSSGGTIHTTIFIGRKGAVCPSDDCRGIYVSTSGQIQ